MIIVTHDMSLARDVFDHVIFLQPGQDRGRGAARAALRHAPIHRG